MCGLFLLLDLSVVVHYCGCFNWSLHSGQAWSDLILVATAHTGWPLVGPQSGAHSLSELSLLLSALLYPADLTLPGLDQ